MNTKPFECRQEQFGDGEAVSELYVGSFQEREEELLSAYEGKVQLIYLDPPFYTGKKFERRIKVRSSDDTLVPLSVPAYEDKWESQEAYLEMIRSALVLCRRLLRPDGTLFLHCDARTSPLQRMLMDEVFGEELFLNEIIWVYQSGGRAKRFFSRKHDTILFYANSPSYFFNLKAVPIGVAMNRNNHMKRGVDEDGRVYRSIVSGGKEYRYYDEEKVYPSDVWDDISHLQQKDPERTGMETQKPLKLLDRIVRCASREGNLVCDLFMGSGTSMVAAAQLGRRFVGTDQAPLALSMTDRRLWNLDRPYRIAARTLVDASSAQVVYWTTIISFTVTLSDFECPQSLEAGLKGLDAIDAWSAGYLKGDTYIRRVNAVRGRDGRLPHSLELPVDEGVPCIMVVDIWGNRRCFQAVREL